VKLDDGYLLMLPGFVDGEENKIILYEVQSMLDLQQSGEMLVGHPSEDLPAIAWGAVEYPVRRVLRWVGKNRLVKARLNAGGTIRVTFSEPGEWQRLITPEQWQWLVQVCEVSAVYTEGIQTKIEPQPTPIKTKAQHKKRPKVKAKIRRKMSKSDWIMEGE
jgi:hypothetical protein